MKLIRDKYALIIDSQRLSTVKNDSEKFIFLSEKISEELEELADTAFTDVEEFADVIEVLYAMAAFKGIYKDEIEITRLKKFDEKGGFEKWLVLKD